MENPITLVPLVRVEDLLAGLENDYPRGHPGRANYCTELADVCRMLHENSNDNSVFNALVHAASEAGSSPRSTGHLDLVDAESVATPSTPCDGLDIEMDCSDPSKPLVRVEELLAGLEKDFPQGHPGRAKYCDELADIFRMLHETSGDDSAYAALVHVEGEASSLRASERASEKAEEFAKFLFTLAMRNKLPELLSSVRTDGEELSGCIDLSALLKTSSADDEDDHPLAPVIASQRAALREYPAGHPDRPYLCEQLAQNLIARHNEDKDAEYLEEVRRLLLDACQLAPPHRVWKYACELSEVHLQHSGADQVDAAIRALHQAIAYQPDDPAGAVHRIIQSLGVIHQRTEDAAERYHSVLGHIYERLIRLLPLLLHPALRDDIPPQALPRCNQLGYDAFLNAVIGNNIPAALELLEAVQSMTLRQRIYRRDPEFDNIPEHMSLELEQLLQSTVHASDGNQPGSEVKLLERSERLYTLIREIRALPGMDRFMLGETYTQLRTVASNDHPVVVLVGAREHFYALILRDPSQGPILLPLHLSQGELEACSTDMRSQRPHRGTMVFLKPPVDLHRAQGSPSSPQRSLNQQLGFMWLQIVKPVFDKLGLRMSRGHDRPRLHWCATGPFSSLPLHAAGIYDGLKSEKACCDDYVVSSYTPTLTALLYAQRTSTPLARNHASLTLVAEKQAQEPNLPMIPGVIRELGAIVSTVQGKSVQVVNQLAGSTTITDTLGVMKVTNIVHLACHGVQDASDATRSGFCLGDGRLTICNMMDSHLKHGFLAYLSACETGKSAKDQFDHAMILATSVFSTGFSNVVATMWSISDRDGPEVAKWFYEELLASDVIDADVIAYALDAAVGKLRDSGVPTNRWVPFIHMGA